MRGARFVRVLVPIVLLAGILAAVVAPTPAAPAPGTGTGIGSATGDAVILNTYDADFLAAAVTFSLPANMIKAVAWVEGGWAGDSVTGAVGIMQIVPLVWGDVARREGYDIHTPHGNI